MLAIGASAQSWGKEGWCIGGFGGATSFAGDIMHTPTSDDNRIGDTRYDFGLEVEKILYPGINARLAASYGKLWGEKQLDMASKPMNQAFEGNFFDYHFDLKLDVLKCLLGPEFPFSAYALAGIGGVSYHSKWYKTTTGVVRNDTTATATIYPLGVGAGIDIGPVHVFAEGTWDVTFTDALDAHLSNNTDHKIQDSYLVFLVGATYEIGGTSKSYGGSRAKSGATKKAQKHRNKSSKNLHKTTSSYRKRANNSKRHYTNGGRTQVKSSHTNSLSTKRKYTTSSGNQAGMKIKKSEHTNSGNSSPKYPVHY